MSQFTNDKNAMSSIIKRIIELTPFPRVRYTMYSGTNSISEWLSIFYIYFRGGKSLKHEIFQYEKTFAEVAGCKFAYSFALGRHALYCALDAMGIGEGDEVIIPAYTCVVVPNAILYRKAVPVYVDIETHTYNIDCSLIEKSITSRTKAIYAQHTFGNICEIDKIKAISKKYKLYVIEDAAHAIGTDLNGRKIGSMGDIAFFSTDRSKIINTMIGGMVTTNNETLGKKLKEIHNAIPELPPQVKQKILVQFLFEYIFFSPYLFWLGNIISQIFRRMNLFYNPNDELIVDYNLTQHYPARLPFPLAIIGISQLNNLDKNLKHRRKIWNIFNQKFKHYQSPLNSSCLRYSFLTENREEFIKKYSYRFDLGLWFTSIAQGRHSNFEEIKYQPNSCPKAEFAANHIVNFPTHQRINSYIETILKSIKN